MKEYAQQPGNTSRQAERQPQASRQAPAEVILQRYQEKSNQTGLPDTLKAGIESLSGYSMDDVKVHYNSSQPARLNALAYAQGTDIHLAPGQGQHLPHEAWHVVQQKQGRVQPTTQLQGVQVNDNEGLEREADRMGKNSQYLNYENQNHAKYSDLKYVNMNHETLQGQFWLKKENLNVNGI